MENSNQADKNKFIEYVYGVAMDPFQYDNLMMHWDAILSQYLNKKDAHNNSINDDQSLKNHIQQASDIINTISKNKNIQIEIEKAIILDPDPAMVISSFGKIEAVNLSARKLLNLSIGQELNQLEIDDPTLNILYKKINNIKNIPDKQLIGIARIGQSQKHSEQNDSPQAKTDMILAFSSAFCHKRNQMVCLVTTLNPVWGPAIKNLVKEYFNLTESEAEIMEQISYGQKTAIIAYNRNTSTETVRGQIKSILHKTNCSSQSELIIIISCLQQFQQEKQQQTKTQLSRPYILKSFEVEPGRKLEYVIIGPPKGKPVIYIHGMLDGYNFTQSFHRELWRKNIRIIAIIRPSFGGSTHDYSKTPIIDRFVSDLKKLMALLDLHSIPIFTHRSGSVFAFAAAAKLKKSIIALVLVCAGIPIVSQRQISYMSPRQRIMAQTAKYSPMFLPLFLRAGIALINSSGEDDFMRALYANSPVDMAATQNKEIRDIIVSGYHFATGQGHRGFANDAKIIVKNWNNIVEKTNLPVIILHGQKDPVVSIESVREFAKKYDNINLIELDNVGHLLLYQRPVEIINAIEKTLQLNEVVCASQ